MAKGVGIRAGGLAFPSEIPLYCKMDPPGPSSRNEIPETPENPTGSNSSEVSTNDNNNFPGVAIEIPLGIGLEDSSEDEHEQPSSEEENVNNDYDDYDDPVNAEPPVDYGFEEDFIGDSNFTLCSRQDFNMLRGRRASVTDWRICAGFSVPEPPIPERLNLLLRAITGINRQQAVLSASGEVIIEQLSAAITGFSITSPRKGGSS